MIGTLAQAIQLPNAFLVVTTGVALGALIVLGPIQKNFEKGTRSEELGAGKFEAKEETGIR
jgi:hypothetical protein